MIVVIDNYDSFTYNLVHYFQELGQEVVTLRNDVLSVQDCLALKPAAFVISPGPCSPDEAGISLPLIRANQGGVPLLGVCLGHQAIGQAYGASVGRVHPVHGKTSQVTHEGDLLFSGIPSPFTAARYHSLAVSWGADQDVPLQALAYSEDGVVMALKHRTLPIYGVQFHPESIASEYGHQLLKNFLSLTGKADASA